MEARQRFLEIRRIFNEVVELEVRKYFDRDTKKRTNHLNSIENKITFFNIQGDMVFLNRYQMKGNGKGNEVISEIAGMNTAKEAPTFIIPSYAPDNSTFCLHLERPDIEHDDRSYFTKKLNENEEVYRLNSEDMLENQEFKECILRMIGDIAPQRVAELQQQIA